MKELSVEEKAKRYDEAIKKAESLYKVAEPMSGCNVIIETLFPELKESEDERIRKDIIVLVKDWWDRVNKNNISTKEQMLAWLEKQGNHTKFTENDTKLIKYIEVSSNVLVKLLESDKFQKDAREHLFDKGDKDLFGIYDIYAEEAVKYAKALYKHLNE